MIYERRGLGHWRDSYGVGMKAAPVPPAYVPARDWADQALLDMAARPDPEPPVYPFEYFDSIARQQARRATFQAGAFLAATYFAAYAIWGTSWL